MTFHMLWIIALGLSMDAFAVSISKGLAMRAFDGNKHWLLHAALDYSKASCLR
jgi:conserved inner membrane protein